MVVKVVNDIAGLDGIVPTLLVFGAYPRMAEIDPPAATITQRAAAIKLAMKEVRRCYASRQVTDALRTRNGPRTQHLQGLPINSKVLVWRKKEKWTGPWKLLSMEGETCKVELQNGPTTFRSTVVKPYYEETDKTKQPNENSEGQQVQNQGPQEQDGDEEEGLEQLVQRNPKRRRQAPH